MQSIGLDIRDLFRLDSTLTPRFVLILAGHFDDSSALYAARRGGPEFRQWSAGNHLLALLVNLTYAANRQRGGKKTNKSVIEPPKMKRKPRRITVAELAQIGKKK